MRKTTWMFIAGTVAAGVLWTATPQAQTNQEKLEISAFAVNMSNIATGSNAQVQLTINSWSTAEERERLITTVLEKGPDALLRELQKAPVKGRFRIPSAKPPGRISRTTKAITACIGCLRANTSSWPFPFWALWRVGFGSRAPKEPHRDFVRFRSRAALRSFCRTKRAVHPSTSPELYAWMKLP